MTVSHIGKDPINRVSISMKFGFFRKNEPVREMESVGDDEKYTVALIFMEERANARI